MSQSTKLNSTAFQLHLQHIKAYQEIFLFTGGSHTQTRMSPSSFSLIRWHAFNTKYRVKYGNSESFYNNNKK